MVPHHDSLLCPGVWVRPASHTGGANTGAVFCRQGVLAIDAAESPAAAREDIRSLRHLTGDPFYALVITHHHADHWFGAQEFDCPLIASEATARAMRAAGSDYLGEVRHHHHHLGPTMAEVRLTFPSRTFEDRLTLDIQPAVELMRLGGHTEGTTVLFVPEVRALFASDLVFNGIHPYTKGADLFGWIAALDVLAHLDPAVVVPGHGSPGNRRLVLEQRNYLCRFVDRLSSLKARGLSLEDVLCDLSLLGLPDLHRPKRLAAGVRAHWDRS